MSSEHDYAIPDALAAEPAAAEIATLMHSAGVQSDIVNDAFAFHASADVSTDYSHRDEGDAQAAHAELRHAWGDQYETNLDTLRRYVHHNVPDDLAGLLINARGKEGRALLNDPRVAVSLFGLASRGAKFEKSGDVKAQIAAIEQLMVEDRKAYFSDPALQMRLRRLYAQRDGKG